MLSRCIVVEPQVEVRVGGLLRDGALEPVAEVRRIGREDAVAEEAEDRLVLLLEPKLELGLVFVEIVEVTTSGTQCSRAMRAWTSPRPGISSPGAISASGPRTNRRSCILGCGTLKPRLVDLRIAVEQQVEIERAWPLSGNALTAAPEAALDVEQKLEQGAGRGASCRERRRRSRSGAGRRRPPAPSRSGRRRPRPRRPAQRAAPRRPRAACAPGRRDSSPVRRTHGQRWHGAPARAYRYPRRQRAPPPAHRARRGALRLQPCRRRHGAHRRRSAATAGVVARAHRRRPVAGAGAGRPDHGRRQRRRPHAPRVRRQAEHDLPQRPDGRRARRVPRHRGRVACRRRPRTASAIVGVYPQAVLQSFDASPLATITDAGAVQGITAAAQHCPGVISLSFGGTGRGSPARGRDPRRLPQRLSRGRGRGQRRVAGEPAGLPRVLSARAHRWRDRPGRRRRSVLQPLPGARRRRARRRDGGRRPLLARPERATRRACSVRASRPRSSAQPPPGCGPCDRHWT